MGKSAYICIVFLEHNTLFAHSRLELRPQTCERAKSNIESLRHERRLPIDVRGLSQT